jgi:hypothetical protein
MTRSRLCSFIAAGAIAVGATILAAPAADATPFGDGSTAVAQWPPLPPSRQPHSCDLVSGPPLTPILDELRFER